MIESKALELCENKLLETLCLLSAVCKLTLTGTWEIPVQNGKADPLNIVNPSEEACFITGYINYPFPARAYFSDVIPLEDQVRMKEAMGNALHTNSVYSIKHRIVREGYTERVIYQRGEPFFIKGNNEPSKMLCICCDITDYQKEYNGFSNNPEDEPAFTTSHQLRAPLSNIIGIANMLNELSEDFNGFEKIRDLLLTIDKQARYLDNAVHKLNSLISKTKSSKFTNKISVDVKQLILIDDEQLANRIHTRLIESVNAEINVISFTDPVKAMQYLKDLKEEALVLLDINMPVMNAWDCLEFMKQNGIETSVVILSSSINPNDQQKAAEFDNVTGFLNKPLTKDNIRWLMTDLLQK